MHKNCLFCVPLVGQFVICDLKNPKEPVLLVQTKSEKESAPTEGTPMELEKSDSPSPISEDPPTKKQSLVGRMFSTLKVAKEKITSTFGSSSNSRPQSVTTKESPGMYFDEESQIDDIIVLCDETYGNVSNMKLLMIGTFSFEVNKIILDISIRDAEWSVIGSSIANFINSDLISFDKSAELQYFILDHAKHTIDGKARVVEATQTAASVYDIDLVDNTVSFVYLIDYPTESSVNRLSCMADGFNLLTYDGSRLYSVSTATMTGREVHRSNKDMALISVNSGLSVVLLSSLDFIEIVDTASKLLPAKIDLYCLENKTV